MNGTPERTKVAVLGGGVGGMTAAFELTATPALRERFEVTVYQLGWRVGGKGASGRNAAYADRIEEHGLHVWFGFYDNAFRLMRDAYAEAGRAPGTPLASFEEAFVGCDELVLYDRDRDGWHAQQFDMPRNFMRPGDTTELPTFWEMAATACRWALGGWQVMRARKDLAARPTAPFTPGWLEDFASDLLELPLDGAERLLGMAAHLAAEAAEPPLLVELLNGFRAWLWSVVRSRIDTDPELRIYFTAIDAGVSTVAGIVEDGILEHGFDVVNDEEWAAWLARHGAREVTIGRTPAERSPVLRAVYDVAFGYLDGDISKANVAAGTATSDLLRLAFTYRGSIMYKMQAGMGDVVFTPLYEVLRARGVRFEFFHAVTKLGLAGNAIDSISVVPQVELASGVDEYDPLVDVKGLACWPSEPRWEQLADGEALRATGVDFEFDHDPLGCGPIPLKRGVDFDEVVLGIPVGALPGICGELIAHDERFRRGIETAATVQTQAFQLWARKDATELGWEHSENSVTGCYVEPLDTYCDMTHLLPREGWTAKDGVKTIGYFCGVLDEVAGETQAEANERVKANALEFVERDMGALWPGFAWRDLVDRSGGRGRKRFDSQYWRANITPSERYVLTPAGSVEHRLASGESGFENLVLAGDWTSNGIDGGCVEAAVISGMEAARTLTSAAPVPGASTRWLQPQQELPAYVEYGGRATAPPPFACAEGKLTSLILQGDGARIAALVSRMFDEPAGRSLDYRAIGSQVLLMIGQFGQVTSQTPPFDRWGSVRETQASFWVPVLAGRDLGDVFVAERLLLAVPYILVDNPMSYLGGREAYGYAKAMGRFTPGSGLGPEVVVEAFGGDFGRGQGADWRELLTLEARGDSLDADGAFAEGPAALVDALVGGLPALDDSGELVVGDFSLGSGLVADMLAGRVGQVFLKQFRDAADGTRACYRSVVEAPCQIQQVRSRPSPADWSVEIHPLDSHPLGPELGLTSQTPIAAFDVEIDFVVENGVEMGRVAAPVGLPTADPGLPGPDGYAGMLEGAARWMWREFTALERASLGLLRRRL